MRLLLWYVGFMAIGDVLAIFLGFESEKLFGSQPSMIIFLVLYTAVLWGTWYLAVWWTEPKKVVVNA